MKAYPSIMGSKGCPKAPCMAFNKLDGSNIRVEWSKKKQGWHKYGTRKRMFDHTDEVFGEAIAIFNDTLAPGLDSIIKAEKSLRECQSIIAFCEFFGEHSFAGQHVAHEPHKLVLFDVNLHKKGLISPRDFYNLFGKSDLPTADLIYEGNLNESFIEDVRNGKYADRGVFEGVICKGGSGHNLWMAKVKTNAYLDKLKTVFHDKYMEFWE